MELSQRYDLSQMSLREIGRLIGEEHPQKVKFHLKKIGLTETKKKKDSKINISLAESKRILSIPILGLANCGTATALAESRLEGILPISRKLIPLGHRDRELFAVKAVGTSMNKADLNGKNIEEGDFVIVDSEDKNVKNGEYVLSVIGGFANIKRFVEDRENNQIVLESESTNFFPPIHIHKDDMDEYFLNGKAIDVIKAPKKSSEEYHFEPIPNWET